MAVTVAVFIVVYSGMMLGRLPGLKVDRSAIALLGAIALLASGEISEADAIASVNFSTVGLLFGLMIVSTQFTLSGLYSEITHRVISLDVSPRVLLAVLVFVSGSLSAFLTNDVVALAMAPVLIQLCVARKLNPVPFLLAMAFSTNAGSTATIIGSPQNMLIGQHLNLSFTGFMGYAVVPSLLGLGVVWVVVSHLYRDRWALPEHVKLKSVKVRRFERGESIKGLLVTFSIVGMFLLTDWPRDQIALAAGALLLANAHYKSRKMLHRVDWQLLVMFMALFVVNGAFQQTHLPEHWVTLCRAYGIDFHHPMTLFVSTMVLSDIVSNVPAVMLLVRFADSAMAGVATALASGMSSNLLIIGSIANIIAVDSASRYKLKISFLEFARSGVPTAVISLLISAGWLWLVAILTS